MVSKLKKLLYVSKKIISKMGPKVRGDEWSLRAFASMPSTAIFLRARAEIKNLLCELASNAKIWGARASEQSFKFCEQLKILMDHSSPLRLYP